MHNSSSNDSDDIIKNLKKVADKYQEIILYLLQGKGNIVPLALQDLDKNRIILTDIYNQLLTTPEKFWHVNLEYTTKLQQLISSAVSKFTGLETEQIFTEASKDKRFKDPVWQDNAYFDFIKQFYLLSVQWIQTNIKQYNLPTDLQNYLEFITSQFIDALSPSNFAFYNPQVLRETLESKGQNLVQGLENFLHDLKNSGDVLNIQITDQSAFKLGQNIACTKGKIIFQNRLIQLICYEPKNQTYSVPVFIVPPCVNKYYILDLSVHNSLVSFLVENHFQVFVVSWVNPDKSYADVNFEDYIKQGIIEPCEYITKLGYAKLNFVGYCIGGTFLAIALAILKSRNHNLAESSTFLTTMLDFEHPGEIGVFINESSITIMEEEMKARGYFDGRYLLNGFSLLRANDLLWSFFINNYLLGKAPLPFDLLYWNTDPTNLPHRMHSYLLRNLYLNNLLREPNKLSICNTKIDLGLIDCNSFFLAANEDHIAPWNSVYAGMKLLNGNKTFCLTNSGHVAGVINPPALSKYSYKINEEILPSSLEWLKSSTTNNGSWWIYWRTWLEANSGQLIQPIDYNNLACLEPAPGSYVHKRIMIT